jgi:hypothetical protein
MIKENKFTTIFWAIILTLIFTFTFFFASNSQSLSRGSSIESPNETESILEYTLNNLI